MMYWKSLVKIPHIQCQRIIPLMKRKHYRVIEVRNNCGDFKKIIIKDMPTKNCWKLKVEIRNR